MSYLNPFRFVGDYIAIHVQPDTDAQATLKQCLEKANFYQAIIVILAHHLTSSVLSDMLVLADQRGQRNRLGYALSDDEEAFKVIKQDAVMVIDAVPYRFCIM